MPYDEDLVHRLRGALVDVDGVTERRMFGGHAFMVARHLCVCASRSGGLMVRVDPAMTDAAVAEAGVERMVMGGRAMDGWLLVAAEAVAGDAALEMWVARGVAFVGTLPPK